MELSSIDACVDDWETLSAEYRDLENIHKAYLDKLTELTNLQQKCAKGIGHQRYRINIIKKSLKNIKPEKGELFEAIQLREKISQRSRTLEGIEDGLPKKNGLYLRIILGNLNVSLPTKRERYEYKKEFERFKLAVMLVSFVTSALGLIMHYRVMDLIGTFLLLWYYCTLTIRESILMVNGSKHTIWQRTLHFVATVMSGIIAVFPAGDNYETFRFPLMGLVAYYSFIQYIQFKQGRNLLYRQRAMGRTHSMHVTSEGFQPYMLSGMTYILPFLFVAYAMELYMAVTLYYLSQTPAAQWHMTCLYIDYATMSVHNLVICSLFTDY
ncbi:unnamed protein product, partial [Meganyctiphanes norvegica]